MDSLLEYQNPKIEAVFRLSNDLARDRMFFHKKERLVQLLWNRSTLPVNIFVDDKQIELLPHQISTLSFYHHLQAVEGKIHSFGFNREFYCMLDHDEEVSCYGLLFFGAQEIPVIQLNPEELAKFELLFLMFLEEFQQNDNIQEEMLQVLLKRLVKKATKLAKTQNHIVRLEQEQIEDIRKFNYLVDFYYKEKKSVAEYAQLMHKSPKTLSNLFHEYNKKSPLQIIHERIALEAKRLLLYSKLNAKEIAFELGYKDPSHFSRLFKKITGQTCRSFRKLHAS